MSPTKPSAHSSPIREERMNRESLCEESTVVPEEDTLLNEKSQPPAFSKFPTLISSQSISTRSRSSRNTIVNQPDSIKDWSLNNKKWLDKRHAGSTVFPKVNGPSMPLSQMMESQSASFSTSTSKRIASHRSGSGNWKAKLDEESINIPDFVSQPQGEYAMRMKQSILGREQFLLNCTERISITIDSKTFSGVSDVDYASLVGLSTQESVHRLLVYFHSSIE